MEDETRNSYLRDRTMYIRQRDVQCIILDVFIVFLSAAFLVTSCFNAIGPSVYMFTMAILHSFLSIVYSVNVAGAMLGRVDKDYLNGTNIARVTKMESFLVDFNNWAARLALLSGLIFFTFR